MGLLEELQEEIAKLGNALNTLGMEKCGSCEVWFKKEELVTYQRESELSSRVLTYRYCKDCYECTTGEKYKGSRYGK